MFERVFDLELAKPTKLGQRPAKRWANMSVIEICGPIRLARSKQARRLSGSRYRNAEAFYSAIDRPGKIGGHDLLYQAGIVAQLALNSHLLDVGFDERWCARQVGFDVHLALSLANSTGFDHQCQSFGELAAILSPYSKWRNPNYWGERTRLPDVMPDVASLLRSLLNHTREVTGHSPLRSAKNRG